MAYIDSNVFIYPVIYQTETQQKAKKAKEILLKIESGELLAYTSALTWDEVVWVVRRVFDIQTSARQGRMLFELPNLTFIPVDRSIISEAQDLVEKYGLTPRDCIHAGSARKSEAIGFISYDSDFDSVKEINRILPDVAISNLSP